jgi:hypothetical protein
MASITVGRDIHRSKPVRTSAVRAKKPRCSPTRSWRFSKISAKHWRLLPAEAVAWTVLTGYLHSIINPASPPSRLERSKKRDGEKHERDARQHDGIQRADFVQPVLHDSSQKIKAGLCATKTCQSVMTVDDFVDVKSSTFNKGRRTDAESARLSSLRTTAEVCRVFRIAITVVLCVLGIWAQWTAATGKGAARRGYGIRRRVLFDPIHGC